LSQGFVSKIWFPTAQSKSARTVPRKTLAMFGLSLRAVTPATMAARSMSSMSFEPDFSIMSRKNMSRWLRVATARAAQALPLRYWSMSHASVPLEGVRLQGPTATGWPA
jgi:hypothetical protein